MNSHSYSGLARRAPLLACGAALSLSFCLPSGWLVAGGSDNTATGVGALPTSTTGSDNTGTGFIALGHNTTGNGGTATGSLALESNTNGTQNTAMGCNALRSNTSGSFNTATGYNALLANRGGNENTANGHRALYANTTGIDNAATGFEALFSNTTGRDNTASGSHCLYANTINSNNTAFGQEALTAADSFNNTAFGYQAGAGDTSGGGNIFLGFKAGINVATGSNNIEIGTFGFPGDNAVTRIGNGGGTQQSTFIDGIYGVSESNGVAVYINSNGQLGTLASSKRFKDNIRDMSDASSTLYSLRPVTFRYTHAAGPQDVPEFGLIAEEVEQIDPALVVHDADGKPYSVRYEQVNAMLLNEFLKEHAQVAAQAAELKTLKESARQTDAAVAAQARVITRQQDEFKTALAEVRELSAAVKTQTALIQQAGLQMTQASGPSGQLAANGGR